MGIEIVLRHDDSKYFSLLQRTFRKIAKKRVEHAQQPRHPNTNAGNAARDLETAELLLSSGAIDKKLEPELRRGLEERYFKGLSGAHNIKIIDDSLRVSYVLGYDGDRFLRAFLLLFAQMGCRGHGGLESDEAGSFRLEIKGNSVIEK